MAKTWAMARRELGAYFLAPTAYVVLFIFLLLSGYFFTMNVLFARVADMRGPLANMAIIILFVVPVLTTRLWSEELRQGTDELLMTAPVSAGQIVLGKYLGAVGVFFVYLAVTCIYPFILKQFGDADLKSIFTGYLGLLLLGAAAIAMGLFASSLSDSQVVAGVVGFGLLLLFWVAGWAGDAMPGSEVGKVLGYLALTPHYQDFAVGVLDTSHAVYFVSLTAGFLFLTARRLEAARWR